MASEAGAHSRNQRQLCEWGAAGGDSRFAVDALAVFQHASRVTLETVEGKIRPRMARTLLETRTASAKSPVTCVSAARNRLPKLCPTRPRPGTETILEQTAEQRFVFGKRDHAIADVAGRKNAIFAAQTAGAAAVIGDGDDGGEVDDGTARGRIRIVARNDVLLEPAKKGGETGAAAESDDAKSARSRRNFAAVHFHAIRNERLGGFTLAENSLETARKRREAQDCCGRTHVGIVSRRRRS